MEVHATLARASITFLAHHNLAYVLCDRFSNWSPKPVVCYNAYLVTY